VTVFNATLTYPPKSLNGMYERGHKRVHLHPEIVSWKFENEIHLRQLQVEACIQKGGVVLVIDVYRPAAKGDIDNRLKMTLDVLQGYAFINDVQVVEMHVRNLIDRKAPRIEVAWWRWAVAA
jgi:Holliday junction resolvase RusA-like endonuclease